MFWRGFFFSWDLVKVVYADKECMGYGVVECLLWRVLNSWMSLLMIYKKYDVLMAMQTDGLRDKSYKLII